MIFELKLPLQVLTDSGPFLFPICLQHWSALLRHRRVVPVDTVEQTQVEAKARRTTLVRLAPPAGVPHPGPLATQEHAEIGSSEL